MLQAKTKEQEDRIESIAKKKVVMAMLLLMKMESLIRLILVSMLTFLSTQWLR